ncbi:UNVERIFIED_CONTAM: hypothetical protein FKN15_014742 [Acipenser sinensis]
MKLQQEVETQEPSTGLDGRVDTRDTGPTPQKPVGDPPCPGSRAGSSWCHTRSKDLVTQSLCPPWGQ